MTTYARRNDEGLYTYRGEKYLSVTTILGHAPGAFLLPWVGKMSSLKVASHLWQAGMMDIQALYKAGHISEKEADELNEFCRSLPSRVLTESQAIIEIASWATNMRESERYRDHKATIGKIMHHAIYEKTMRNNWDCPEKEWFGFVESIIRQYNLLPIDNPDGPTDAMVDAMTRVAHAYVSSAFKFLDLLEPEPIFIGQEAMVVFPYGADEEDPVFGYAGTLDAIYRVRRTLWQKFELALKLYPWRLLHGDQDSAVQVWDYKSSNQLSKSFPAQIEAYRHAKVICLETLGSEDYQEHPMEISDCSAVLHVGPDEELSGLKDEFGTLSSKTKQTGASLHVYPSDETAWRAFKSLFGWVRWSDAPTKPLEAPKAEPKAKAPTKKELRPAPFA